jgi:uncharacterized protein YqgQ
MLIILSSKYDVFILIKKFGDIIWLFSGVLTIGMNLNF